MLIQINPFTFFFAFSVFLLFNLYCEIFDKILMMGSYFSPNTISKGQITVWRKPNQGETVQT